MRFVKPRISKAFGMLALETPYNEDYVECLKYCVPPQDRQWDPNSRLWLVSKRYYGFALHTLRHFFGGAFIDSVGGLEEAQAEDWKEKFDVWIAGSAKRQKQEKRGAARPTKSDDGAYAVLFVRNNAPAAVIKAAYRALSVIYHPDKGGDVEMMQRLNAAYDELKHKGVTE